MDKLEQLKDERTNLIELRDLCEGRGQALSRAKQSRLVFLNKAIYELEN